MHINQFQSIEERINISRLFYQQTNKRPLVGFFLGNEYPNIRYPSYENLPVMKNLQPEDFAIAPFLENCETMYQSHGKCGGDLFWTGTPFWGIPWIEAMLGFPLQYNIESKSITAHNEESMITPELIPSFSEDNAWVQLFQNYFIQLARHSRGRYPLGTTRIRGLADILAILFGGEQMVFKAISEPELVCSALEKITRFYIDVMEFQIKHIPDFYGGMGSFYYYLWTPGDTVWHQEDSVMLLSPTLYDELIRPFDQTIYDHFKNNICHFHSTGGYIPYKEIILYNPLAIEMHLDKGGPTAEELYDHHHEILKTTPLIIWGEFSRGDLDWVFSKLPPGGLALNIVVQSAEEAVRIWETYIS